MKFPHPKPDVHAKSNPAGRNANIMKPATHSQARETLGSDPDSKTAEMRKLFYFE